MTKLWHLLTQELGSAFKRQYGLAGGSPFMHWTKELERFTEAELVQGLERFKRSGSTYISLNVFRNHCAGQKQDEPRLGRGLWTKPEPLKIAHGNSKLKQVGNEALKKLKDEGIY